MLKSNVWKVNLVSRRLFSFLFFSFTFARYFCFLVPNLATGDSSNVVYISFKLSAPKICWTDPTPNRLQYKHTHNTTTYKAWEKWCGTRVTMKSSSAFPVQEENISVVLLDWLSSHGWQSRIVCSVVTAFVGRVWMRRGRWLDKQVQTDFYGNQANHTGPYSTGSIRVSIIAFTFCLTTWLRAHQRVFCLLFSW